MRLMVIGGISDQIIAASKIAAKRGARVFHVADIKAALNALRRGKGADLLLVEVAQDIKSLIVSLREERIDIPVIACGIAADKEQAVQAIKAGAREYISLPPEEEIIIAVLESIAGSDSSIEIVFRSQAFTKIIQMAEQIAPSAANILISGESGTGKEVIAKYIHKKSRRSHLDLISINCAAIPENLLESELFGHERGAFTGAVERRIGKFEEAQGSTILLDEISEMDLRLQAKLLRVIQEREMDRVGGSKSIKLDIRILATSNRDLAEEVKIGRFREDLFFRLNVINLILPPLKERKEDIPLMIDLFMKKYAELNDVKPKPFSSSAIDKLLNYEWPGNVRELENTVYRALLLSVTPEITADDILLTLGSHKANNDHFIARTLEAAEREAIEQTWKKFEYNYDTTARVLGVTIKTLKKKLDKYKMVV